MSVFTWTPKPIDPDTLPKDEWQTTWYISPPSCLFCGNYLLPGQRVFAWQGHRVFHAHAACVKDNARGLMKDIGECLR